MAVDDDGTPLFGIDSLGNEYPVDSLGNRIITDTIKKDSSKLKIKVRKLEKK